MMKRQSLKYFLTEEDKKNIEETVSRVESVTSAEIRVVVARRSVPMLLLPFLDLFGCTKAKLGWVKRHAKKEFRTLGVRRTSARTGILILISLAEKHLYILPDSAVSEKIPQDFWDRNAKALAEQIGMGTAANGIILTLASIQSVLELYFPIEKGDRNELPDKIKLE